MNQEVNQKETKQLYSQRAISIATYFGGPLAAGILARQNFINLGKEDLAKTSLTIGIVSTLLMFVVVFSVPEEIMEKIPNFLIPLIYTGIIYLLIDKFQGTELKEHKDNSRPFYSGWKATGIGAGCMLVLVGGILGYAYLSPSDFDTLRYDKGISDFEKNEGKALLLFSMFEKNSPAEIVDYIDKAGIPAWKENIVILDDLDKIVGLSDRFKTQNEVLRQYSNLRIETFELMKKALREDSNMYDKEIEVLNGKIDEILKSL